MRHFLATAMIGLTAGQWAMAAPQAIYEPPATLTAAPVVDATTFYNAGVFNLAIVSSVSNIAQTTALSLRNALPFSTTDTQYFTNTSSGLMLAIPGFQLDHVSSTTRGPAAWIINQGTIEGEDVPAGITTIGGLPVVADSQPVASQLIINATNVYNENGYLGVGEYGLLNIQARNFTNYYGALAAGAVDTANIYSPLSFTGGSVYSYIFIPGGSLDFNTAQTNSFATQPQDTTGRGGWDSATDLFTDPPNVWDLAWGILANSSIKLEDLASSLPQPPGNGGDIALNFRGGTSTVSTGIGIFSPDYLFYQDQYQSDGGPNGGDVYYDLVFVGTNELDTNISVSTSFGGWTVPGDVFGDKTASSVMVEFGVSTLDVITGQQVTNAIYFIDTGAAATNPIPMYHNAQSEDNNHRPGIFEIATTAPDDWIDGGYQEQPSTYDSSVIFTNGTAGFETDPVAVNGAEYIAQVGRNPETLDGLFPNIVNLPTGWELNLPDPTNDTGRIQITARNANMGGTRLRSEGMTLMNITNLVNGSGTVQDWGSANLSLGSTNGSLVVSNFVPVNYQRVRGLIQAWAISYNEIFTNAFTASGGVTNTNHYHILVLNPELHGNFTPTIRNLGLVGSNAVDLVDNLRVINQYEVLTTNMQVDATMRLTANAGNFYSTNAPNLKNLFVNTNGVLWMDGTLDLGYNATAAPPPLTKRKYTVSTVTNLGDITAATTLLQVSTFENDGVLLASNNGSVVIDSAQLGMGLYETNGAPNAMLADGNITLSANNIEATNSVLECGFANNGTLGTLILDPGEQLTDFTPGIASTNYLIDNYWSVTGGFNLANKPATGDLFGTEIVTTATNFSQVNHVWAGVDLGPLPSSGGWANNAVIGHLKVSVQSPGATLHFTGATSRNAMYVDFLEFDTNSTNFSATPNYGGYRTWLDVDPSLTIYFAAANIDPVKLEDAYSNSLVWVPSFAGPNSTVAVPYTNGSTNIQYCLMNVDLANSPDVSSAMDSIPNAYAPNKPYILNNPTTGAFVGCPTDGAMDRLLVYNRSATSTNYINIGPTAGGRITPDPAKYNTGPKGGKLRLELGDTYNFTAIASNGWHFDGWTALGGDSVTTNRSKLTFTLEDNENISATANFSPNPFTLQKGVYNGLFYQTNNVTPDTAGFVNLTLNGEGAFSGRLLMGPNQYGFSSKFPTNGIINNLGVPRSSLNISLDLNTTNAVGVQSSITGTVTDGSWTAALFADQDPGAAKSPHAGKYTMALPWSSGYRGETNLAGDSYGVIGVSRTGMITIAGQLSDGSPFSQAVPVSSEGRWPFYTYDAHGKDILLGWVVFTNGAPQGTNTSWTKGVGTTYYPAGFTNVLSFAGATNRGSFSVTAPVILLTGGNLSETISNVAVLGKHATYYGTNSSGTNVTLTVDAPAGTFRGEFYNSAKGKKETFGGVLLDNQNTARGFFLGTNESGAVLMQPAGGGQ